MSKRVFQQSKRVDGSRVLNVDSVSATSTVTVSGYSVLTTGSDITTNGAVSCGSSTATVLKYIAAEGTSFSSAQSKFGSQSLYFAGGSSSTTTQQNSGLIISGLSSSIFSRAWTLEAWVYPTVSNQPVVFYFGGDIVQKGYAYLQLDNSGTVYFAGKNIDGSTTGGSASFVLTSSGYSLNTFNHLAFGMNTSNVPFLAVNGLWTSGSALSLDWTEMGTDLYVGCQPGSLWSQPTFDDAFQGYIDDIRLSKTAMYSANYTVPTTVFTSDSFTTGFLHHCEGGFINTSGQEFPTLTSTTGANINTSGVATLRGGAYSQVGNYETETGNIITSGGYVRSYRKFSSVHNGWQLGGSAIINASGSLSSTSGYGVYEVASPGWSTYSNTTHNIFTKYLVNHWSNQYWAGKLTVFCSSKFSGGVKMGVLECHVMQNGNSTPVVLTIATSKSSTLTTLSIAASNARQLVVTTDSDCRISYHWVGAI